MRKVFAMILVIILFSSTGCSLRDGQGEEIYNLSNTSWGNMLETEEGYYMAREDEGGTKLYYADKSDLTQWVPLCNKPDCAHDISYKSSCNAYFTDFGGYCLEIIEDKIYCYTIDYVLRMDLTGENHEEVRDLRKKGLGQRSVYCFYYNGDPFYYIKSFTSKFGDFEADDSENVWTNRFVILDPESPEKDISIIDEEIKGGAIEVRAITWNTMNYQKLYIRQYECDGTGARIGQKGIYEFQEEDNTLVEVDMNVDYTAWIGDADGQSYRFVEGQGIFCNDTLMISDDRAGLVGGMAHDYLYTNDCACEDAKDGLVFYDLQGNVIGSMLAEKVSEHGEMNMWGFSDEHIFIQIMNEASGTAEMYAIDAAALAKGRIEYVQCF